MDPDGASVRAAAVSTAMESKMPIEKVDAHHHLWSLGSPHYPMMKAPDLERFIGNTGGLKHEFGFAEFAALAEPQNVTGSVYVESHFSPPIEEVAFVQAIADAHGLPSAIMGRADLAADDFAAALDVHQRSPRFRGIRAMVNWDPEPSYTSAPNADLLRDPAWRRGYSELGARGLVAEVMAAPLQLLDLARLAEANPRTRLVVGHAGLPFNRSPDEAALWREGMRALAALPHVMVKISGLAMTDHCWTTASIRPVVEEVIALFGADRAMFASNFPVDGLHATYDRVWDSFDAITADYSAADRAALFRDTARRVFAIA